MVGKRLRLKSILGVATVMSILSTFWIAKEQVQCEEAPSPVSSTCWHMDAQHAMSFRVPTSVRDNQQDRRTRILLGISSNLYLPVSERQRRHLIRNTYLDFDRVHNPDQVNRVCRLQDFLQTPSKYLGCQLIYTFVLGPSGNETETFLGRYQGEPLEASLFDNPEEDVIYLNVLID